MFFPFFVLCFSSEKNIKFVKTKKKHTNNQYIVLGWLFVDSSFWTNARVEAYLSGVNDDQLIILDLYSEIDPQYVK